MTRVYFDHNATTPLSSEARAAMVAFLDEPGNPSSLHAEGRRARDAVERARDAVAALVGARREDLVFTSGGTEANNWAVTALAERARAADARRVRVLLSAVEHPCVDAPCAALAARGFVVERLRVDGDGRVDREQLAARLDDTTALLTVQLANPEIGTIQAVADFAGLARARGALVHTDAVQAVGKIPVDVGALGVHALTLSAHKIGGPKGVGALYVARELQLPSLLRGGHQERERRPGTENALGIVGFGAAAANVTPLSGALRDRFEAGAVALGARVHAALAPRVPNTSNVAFPGVDGELLMEALDIDGFAVSNGAACSSGTRAPSPVIVAIGQPPNEAVRFSFGRTNTPAEVDAVLARLPSLLARIRHA
ncbi:MAG TPA: cysteine desulfurase family protein [Polyangia bacterium]|nr:cysteine desulfurase family protein [Polyangia bacterium]